MSAKVQFAQMLFDRLWEIYRQKMPYARIFEEMVKEAGGRFVNDHIALRTLHIEGEELGISFLARIFLALGFEPQEKEPLLFPDQHLLAFSYRHPDADLPKVFISQLQVAELKEPVPTILRKFAERWWDFFGDGRMEALQEVDSLPLGAQSKLLDDLVRFFTQSPWRSLPKEDELLKVNEQSQYGAWVMLFGNNVNHFTGYVNAIGVEALNDVEKVAAAMAARGVPMKEEIEGERGSKLRQTSTKAALAKVKVLDANGNEKEIQWAYAYFEIAERGIDPETGQLFHGFIGPQATKLFEMTKMKQ